MESHGSVVIKLKEMYNSNMCMYMYNDKTGQATIRMNRQAVLKR